MLAADNFFKVQAMLLKRHDAYWTRIAAKIDRTCQVAIPMLFATALLFLSGIEFTDPYKDDPDTEMFAGPGNGTITATRVIVALIPCFVVLLGIFGWSAMRYIAHKHRLIEAPLKPHDTRREWASVLPAMLRLLWIMNTVLPREATHACALGHRQPSPATEPGTQRGSSSMPLLN